MSENVLAALNHSQDGFPARIKLDLLFSPFYLKDTLSYETGLKGVKENPDLSISYVNWGSKELQVFITEERRNYTKKATT